MFQKPALGPVVFVLFAQGLLAAPAVLPADTGEPKTSAVSPVVARLRADVEYLSSDSLKGRRSGTPEADAAAAWVAGAFRKAGLLAGAEAGSYLQVFTFIDGVVLGTKNALVTAGGAPVGRSWTAGTDFQPLGFSAPGSVEGEVVFAGYGISAKDPAYDDYAGLDVSGKTVLVLRHGPDGDDPKSSFSPFAPLRNKASVAREKGAKAILFVTGPLTKDVADELISSRTDASFSDEGIPALSIKRPVAEALFAGAGKTLEDAQRALDSSKKPESFPLPKSRVQVVADLAPHRVETANVIGLLPGSDPLLSKQTIVVGAHYDHLGTGGAGSLEASPEGKIHHGADDNASGVAGILELARSFAARRKDLRRSLLFISFSGEEEGTLGSLYFTKHPTIPLETVVTMVNLDMVGRLRKDTLDIHGVGTSLAFKPLIEAANVRTQLKLIFHEGGFGPSDHSSFYAASRPVLFMFTGSHSDYHKSSDTAEKLNFVVVTRLLELLTPLLEGLLNAPEPPPFTRAAAAAESSPARGLRVWVGSIPDYSEEGSGVRLSGVSPGSPAEKAGLKAGDVLVKFGDRELKNIYDYTYALQDHKPGDKVMVVVQRQVNGQPVSQSLEVTLGSRPSAGK